MKNASYLLILLLLLLGCQAPEEAVLPTLMPAVGDPTLAMTPNPGSDQDNPFQTPAVNGAHQDAAVNIASPTALDLQDAAATTPPDEPERQPGEAGTTPVRKEGSTPNAAPADDVSVPTTTSLPERGPGTPSPAAAGVASDPLRLTIGRSYEERPIDAYRFGTGPRSIVFVGAIHGGYEWNTAVLAYEIIDFIQLHPEAIPPDATLYIIPIANPDGTFAVTGIEGRFSPGDINGDTVPGRFNGRGVDLNRNWECDWSPTAVWREAPISGGEAPFSEPANRALRDFLLDVRPAATVFWHSAANGVFAAGCDGLFAPAWELATLYSQASGYPLSESFDRYPVTGDASDWMATQGLPAITVELINHWDIDWDANIWGFQAVLNNFGR